MAFTLGTGTFTNGSTSVTNVSLTSGRLSYFDTGTRMVVGRDPVLAEVEATKAPSNTEITLRFGWPFATGTYAFLANMTSEGIRDAVQSLKTASEQLDEANAVIAAVGSIYESVSDGLAATVSGDYFSVSGSNPDIFSILYRNDSGSATEISRLASAEAIEQAAIEAQNAATSAALAEDWATSTTEVSGGLFGALKYAQDAQASASAASTSESNAATSATESQQFRDESQDWAENPENVEVEPGRFSSLHWSAKSEGFSVSASDSALLSEEWATSLTLVDGVSYGSKKYAQDSEQSASEALQYRNTAASYANFVGQWTSLTGALTVPASVEHNGVIWQLLVDLAEVTTSEPSNTNPDWLQLTSASTTDDLPEGTTNLYFTDARAVSAIQADPSWNAGNWDTAYSWGDHAAAGYALQADLQVESNRLDALTVATVAEAKALDVPVGTVVETQGYTSSGDGGANRYVVVAGGAGGILMSNGDELLSTKSQPIGNGKTLGDEPDPFSFFASEVNTKPVYTLGDEDSVLTALRGDFSRCTAKAHHITGQSTLTQPASGYVYTPPAYGHYTVMFNTSGHNESLSSNEGRTAACAYRVKIDQNGHGDAVAYNASVIVRNKKAGATSHLANPAAVLFNGTVIAGENGVYLNPREIGMSDRGYDVAAAGDVIKGTRTNNTGSLDAWWVGYRVQTGASTVPWDVAFSAAGSFKYGLDLSNCDFGADKAAITLKEGQRTYLNASDSDPLRRFPSSLTNYYTEYSSGSYKVVINNSATLQVSENQLTSTKRIRTEVGFNVAGSNGVDGSFTTADGKTVTVTKGIITSIV